MTFSLLLAMAVSGIAAPAAEPRMRDLFPGKSLLLPGIEQELGRDVYHRDWDFSRPDKGNFTFFSPGVKQLEVTPEKALRFVMGGNKAILGWGNYKDQQPLSERINMWPVTNFVELKVKQSGDKSMWRLRYWHDGLRIRHAIERELRGRDWQVLQFPSRYSPYKNAAEVVPDAFDVEIESDPGNVIEIASLRITRNLHEGYCRKEFDLPDGPVWRAMAEVGIGAYLFVNGKRVPIEHAMFHRPRLDAPAASRTYRATTAGTLPVDIKPYLKPGRNCIGLYARQVNDSQLVYVHGAVVMVSGDVIRFASDETWRFSPKAPANWSKAGFDDGDWKTLDAAGWDDRKHVAWHCFWEYLLNSWLIGTGGGWIGPAFPFYQGRIVLENPYESKLYYDAQKPVVVRVRVPSGLAERRPSLGWILRRVRETGEEEIAKGGESDFDRAGDSLVYEVRLGNRPRGVYSIEVALRAGDDIIEERPREALVVLGKIPMKEVAGDSYEDGMKLTLEDTIDFTDPNDPHPWVETDGGAPYRKGVTKAVTKPRIVRRNGLVYRETAPIQRHQYSSGAPVFSYMFEFKHPGALYMMALEYPNDAERWIGVSCSTNLLRVHNNCKAGPSVWTGGKYPLTNKMQELRWIFRSGPGPHTIDILPLQLNSTAAAARLRIYRIDELPALRVNPAGVGDRLFGVYTERTTHHASFAKTFGPTVQLPLKVPCAAGDFRPIPERLQYLRRCLDACETYTRYLRFTGQNMHAMGCHQYNDGNTPFSPVQDMPTARVPRDLREMAVRVFKHNGISVIGVMSYAGHRCLGEEYPFNDGQVAAGVDFALMVSKEGKHPGARRPGRGYGAGWNFMHPRVQELMLSVVEAAAEKFKDQPNFKGIGWTCYLTGEWMPGFSGMRWKDPLDFSYDDATIKLFEKDTGIKVPGDPKDPRRFGKRYDFLTSGDMREKWIAWRCRKIHEFFLKARDIVRSKRSDLDLFVSLYIDVPHDKAWAESGKSVRDFLREWGYDLALYRNDENLRVSRWMNAILHSAPARRTPNYAVGWEQSVGPQFIELYAPFPRPAVTLMHQWFEIYYRFPGAVCEAGPKVDWCKFVEASRWPVPGNRGRHLVQPCGDNAREAFVQAMIGTDPQSIMYGFMDVNMMAGQEQKLREFARVFDALPGDKFQPALDTSLQTNLAIRDLEQPDGYVFYVANPGYWPIRGSVTLSAAATVLDLSSNRPIETETRDGKTVVPVNLKPYDMTAYRVEGARVKVASWTNQPVAAEHLAHLRGIIERADALMHNRKVRDALSEEESAFMKKAVADAQADLAAGRYARAWFTATRWRFWTLLREKMEPAAR